MKAVKFLLAHTLGTLYRPGEEATFEDGVANELIALKVAEPVKMKGGAKKENAPTPTAAERAEAARIAAETLSQKEKQALSGMPEADLDKIITDEKIEGVAVDATMEDKIAAIIAARVPTRDGDGGREALEDLSSEALDKIIADEGVETAAKTDGGKIDAIVKARAA